MAKIVMVVDDDPDLLELLDLVLSEEGYQVVPCPVSTEACHKARQVRPAVVIVNLIMHGLDGWQVIEQLKADPATAGIPLIVCSAAVTQATEQSAALRRRGCEILVKPFEIGDLLAMVAKAVERRNRNCL